MRKLTFVCFIVFYGLTTSAQKLKRNLVWEENFSKTSLDTTVWNIEVGNGCPTLCGWGNNERQVYTVTNHQIKNGKLIITAKKEENRYTSTRITTAGKKEFLYGRIEAKVKLPKGKGIWPAFWMLGSSIKQVGWPLAGEIDILEYVGKHPQFVYTSLHTQESHGETLNTKKTQIPIIEKGYHVFAIDWNADKIVFLVDEQAVYTYQPSDKNENNWPFNHPFYVLVNLAVGGNFGGPEVDDSIFPQSYLIDYIRVYR